MIAGAMGGPPPAPLSVPWGDRTWCRAGRFVLACCSLVCGLFRAFFHRVSTLATAGSIAGFQRGSVFALASYRYRLSARTATLASCTSPLELPGMGFLRVLGRACARETRNSLLHRDLRRRSYFAKVSTSNVDDF